jgi:hypothetical protein
MYGVPRQETVLMLQPVRETFISGIFQAMLNFITGSGDVLAELISLNSDESKITSGNGNITIYIPENSKASVEAVVKFTEGGTWGFDKKISQKLYHQILKQLLKK